MFDFFRRHTRVLQFVLVLLVFPSFVFFGIQGYSRFSGGDQQTVAKVAGTGITQIELDNVMRDRIERARRQMPSLDAKIFDTPEMRRLALDSIIRDRVLSAAADKLHLVTTDERLDSLFKSDPQFAQLRRPDGSVNADALAAVGMSSEIFAERLREDISRRQVLQSLADSSIAPAAAASAALDAMYQQREVQVQRFEAKDYAAQVAPTDAQIDAFYKDPAHAAQFQAPEQASIEYVALDLDGLKKGVTVSDDDLHKYYTENVKRYTSTEERHVRQILVAAAKDAPKAERDKAKAKAEALAAEARKDPKSFAALAEKNSDDDSTAKKGGDMEFFARGSMLDLKPFEDAAFQLKPGEIAGPVETDFGYHVIQLVETRGGETKPFDAVKADMESEIRNQLAQKKFSDAAVEFGDTVYEQSDSLKPAADKWKLDIRKADHVTPVPAAGAASGPLGSAKFLEAIFSNDATRNKHNTKAIDIGGNQLVAGRIVQYTPSRMQPLADVKDKVRAQLVAAQSAALAEKLGAERLAAVRAAPATTLSDNTLLVSRAQPHDLPRNVLDAVLKAPVATLPAFVGVDLGAQGYVVAKITKLWGRDPSVADPAKARDQYARIWGDAESQAYYEALKARYKVSVSDNLSPSADSASATAR